VLLVAPAKRKIGDLHDCSNINVRAEAAREELERLSVRLYLCLTLTRDPP
jgi:hypothetical protein